MIVTCGHMMPTFIFGYDNNNNNNNILYHFLKVVT